MRKFLKEQRLSKNFRQKDMAQKLRIIERQYQNIESGSSNSRIEYWLKIAEILDSTVEELFKKE